MYFFCCFYLGCPFFYFVYKISEHYVQKVFHFNILALTWPTFSECFVSFSQNIINLPFSLIFYDALSLLYLFNVFWSYVVVVEYNIAMIKTQHRNVSSVYVEWMKCWNSEWMRTFHAWCGICRNVFFAACVRLREHTTKCHAKQLKIHNYAFISWARMDFSSHYFVICA